jgi:uncharacterized LabA/DUF88 family protein
MRAIYYTALMDDAEYSPIRPLIDWLDYNGFMVVTKPAKEFTDAQGRRKVKGNMDIEIAVDVMELAPSLDHIVLFSGRWRLPLAGAGSARQGLPRDGDLDDGRAPADGGR